MKVRLFEIAERPSQFSFQLARKELHKLEERFNFDQMECEAELNRAHESIILKGSYQVTLKTSCDLCLETISLELDREFRLDLVSDEGESTPDGDIEITMDSPELDFYSGEELLMEEYFEDQLILDLPLNISCSEVCKGLCSVCGTNLNQEKCNCLESTETNPFSVLKDLKPDSES
jgi:DUF177 domain-containing protein